jgi:hypothetical protein
MSWREKTYKDDIFEESGLPVASAKSIIVSLIERYVERLVRLEPALSKVRALDLKDPAVWKVTALDLLVSAVRKVLAVDPVDAAVRKVRALDLADAGVSKIAANDPIEDRLFSFEKSGPGCGSIGPSGRISYAHSSARCRSTGKMDVLAGNASGA